MEVFGSCLIIISVLCVSLVQLETIAYCIDHIIELRLFSPCIFLLTCSLILLWIRKLFREGWPVSYELPLSSTNELVFLTGTTMKITVWSSK